MLLQKNKINAFPQYFLVLFLSTNFKKYKFNWEISPEWAQKNSHSKEKQVFTPHGQIFVPANILLIQRCLDICTEKQGNNTEEEIFFFFFTFYAQM